MANVPQVNTGGIQSSEGLLQQLFQYIQSLGGGSTSFSPIPMTGLPNYKGLNASVKAANNAPMTAMPGGGVDPTSATSSFTSSNLLSSNPVRSQIQQQRQATRTAIQGENLALEEGNLFNNQGMSNYLGSLLGQIAGGIGQLGTYPPLLRGMAQSTAASGTGSGGGLSSMFGF